MESLGRASSCEKVQSAPPGIISQFQVYLMLQPNLNFPINTCPYVCFPCLHLGDFDGALSIFTEMSYHAQERGSFEGDGDFSMHSTYKRIVTKCEVNRVLLLMILQPNPQKIQQEHVQTLEKYLWDTDAQGSPIPWLSEELFLLMQSLVMSCQSRDVNELSELEKDLWKFFDNEQKHLLHLVVCKISKSDG